ncbi:MAG: hypothetical protein KME05_24810 [Gloeocapsa sp. UFS-A4-WI-NPMV-4B04]|jgi:hypothetical protein|nr:hypothetical protein [Gloeocapsa sp. UFS-A4-WI-NPMV-4B04]
MLTPRTEPTLGQRFSECVKGRGGVILIAHSPIPASYQQREQHNQSLKLEIARKALALFQEGQVVISTDINRLNADFVNADSAT